MEQKNRYHLILSIMHITSPSPLGIPVLLVVLGILVGTSVDLMIVVVYKQHIAVLLVMMIVDSISTGDTLVVYPVLYVGVLHTKIVHNYNDITQLLIPSCTSTIVVSIIPSNSPIVATTDTV